MSDWLLDTHIVSALMRQDPGLLARLAGLAEDEILHVSVVTDGEIRYGLQRMPAGRRRRALEQAFERLLSALGPLLDVTREVSETYALIEADLELHGISLPENDLWIAAIALSRTTILVADDRHFDDIPSLRTENWLLTGDGGPTGAS